MNEARQNVAPEGSLTSAANEAAEKQKNASNAAGSIITVESGPSALRSERGLAYTLASNIDKINDMEAVKALSGREMNDRTKSLPEQIGALFKSFGNKVFRAGLGEVNFGEYGVGGVLNHRPVNRAKMVSLTAAPEVIKNGKQIGYDPNWKGRGYPSYVFAAPVTINGTPVFVAAVVNQAPDNKFYMVECVDSNGNYVRINETPSGNTKTGLTAQGGITGGPDGASESIGTSDNPNALANDDVMPSDSANIINGPTPKVNTEKSEPRYLPTAEGPMRPHFPAGWHGTFPAAG